MESILNNIVQTEINELLDKNDFSPSRIKEKPESLEATINNCFSIPMKVEEKIDIPVSEEPVVSNDSEYTTESSVESYEQPVPVYNDSSEVYSDNNMVADEEQKDLEKNYSVVNEFPSEIIAGSTKVINIKEKMLRKLVERSTTSINDNFGKVDNNVGGLAGKSMFDFNDENNNSNGYDSVVSFTDDDFKEKAREIVDNQTEKTSSALDISKRAEMLKNELNATEQEIESASLEQTELLKQKEEEKNKQEKLLKTLNDLIASQKESIERFRQNKEKEISETEEKISENRKKIKEITDVTSGYRSEVENLRNENAEIEQQIANYQNFDVATSSYPVEENFNTNMFAHADVINIPDYSEQNEYEEIKRIA